MSRSEQEIANASSHVHQPAGRIVLSATQLAPSAEHVRIPRLAGFGLDLIPVLWRLTRQWRANRLPVEVQVFLKRKGKNVPSYETVFQKAEAVAAELATAAAKLQRFSRAMGKAAMEGNPAKIRQAIEQIQLAAGEVERLKSGVNEAWPFSDEDVRAHLESRYTDELMAATKSLGIKLTRLEDRLAGARPL